MGIDIYGNDNRIKEDKNTIVKLIRDNIKQNKNEIVKLIMDDSSTFGNIINNVMEQKYYRKDYINKHYITKDVISYSDTCVSLESKSRIAAIKPGVDSTDAINKKQMEDHN